MAVPKILYKELVQFRREGLIECVESLLAIVPIESHIQIDHDVITGMMATFSQPLSPVCLA